MAEPQAAEHRAAARTYRAAAARDRVHVPDNVEGVYPHAGDIQLHDGVHARDHRHRAAAGARRARIQRRSFSAAGCGGACKCILREHGLPQARSAVRERERVLHFAVRADKGHRWLRRKSASAHRPAAPAPASLPA